MLGKLQRELIKEDIAEVYKIDIEIGEGRTLDPTLLQQIEKIALSSVEFQPQEKEFFLTILKNPEIHNIEDWKKVQFVSLAKKANVKIKLVGKKEVIINSSEESTERLIKLLKQSYKDGKNSKVKKVFDQEDTEVKLLDTYVNLAVVNYDNHKKKQENSKYRSFDDARMINSYEQIHGKKNLIALKQLFQTSTEQSSLLNNSVIPQRLLIEGWAGIGKTVFCQYLSLVWAQDNCRESDKWWPVNARVVIRIQLRNLSQYDEKNCRLGEVVRREGLGVTSIQDNNYPCAAQIEADLHNLGENVILLLDGFDEVADWYHKLEKGTKQTLTPQSELIQNILINNSSRFRVILTSRPYRNSQILNIIDRRFEVIGFTDENIQEYVKNYFVNSPGLADDLLNNIKSNVNLWGIAHVPVNLSLICSIYSLGELKINFIQTMTELYNEVILWLLRRDWQKHPVRNLKKQLAQQKRLADLGVVQEPQDHENPNDLFSEARSIPMSEFEQVLKPYSQRIQLLNLIAWHAQTSDQHDLLIPGTLICQKLIEYYQDNLSDKDIGEILEPIRSLGLLESQFNDIGMPISKNNFYFPHLTFQEYFSAKFWVSLFCNPASREQAILILKKYKYNKRFEITWSFVSGLLIDKYEQLNEFFAQLTSDPQDFIYIYHIILEMRCLNECRLSARSHVVDRILSAVCDLIDKVSRINGTSLFRKTLFKQLGHVPYIYGHKSIIERIRSYLADENTQFFMSEILDISMSIPEELIKYILVIFIDSEGNRNYVIADILSKPLNAIPFVTDKLHELLDNANTTDKFKCDILRILSAQNSNLEKIKNKILLYLDHHNPKIRNDAMNIIFKNMSIFKLDQYKLSKYITDKNMNIYVILALSQLDNLSEETLVMIGRLLTDSNKDLRRVIVGLFRKHNYLSSDAINEIVNLRLQCPSVFNHIDIWRALSLQKNFPGRAVDIVLEYFNFSLSEAKWIPLEFLIDHPELLVIHRAKVVACLEDPDEDGFVLASVVRALTVKLEPTQVELEMIAGLIHHRETFGRKAAILGLSNQKIWSPTFLDLIKTLLKDSDYENRLFMLRKLGRNLYYARMFNSEISYCLIDEAFKVRFKAVKILNKIGWSNQSIKLWVRGFKDLDTPYLLESMTFLVSWTTLLQAIIIFKTEIIKKSNEGYQLMQIIIFKALYEMIPFYIEDLLTLRIGVMYEIHFEKVEEMNSFIAYLCNIYEKLTGYKTEKKVMTNPIHSMSNALTFFNSENSLILKSLQGEGNECQSYDI